MYRYLLLFGLIFCGTGLITDQASLGDIVATTSTLDSAVLDFDGAGQVSDGNLEFATADFFLTGTEIPADADFAGITSMTISFQVGAGSPAGTFLSARAGGIIPPGIGISTLNESTAENIGSLGGAANESLSVSVSSTSSNGDAVYLTGVEFNSWRNFFPFSEVGLSGATFGGGQAILTGKDGAAGPDPILIFDNPVNAFTVQGIGEPIRMANIRLGVRSIPEPGMLSLLAAGTMGMILRRRRIRR